MSAREGSGRSPSAARRLAGGRASRRGGPSASAAARTSRVGPGSAAIAVRSHIPGRTRLGIPSALSDRGLERLGARLAGEGCRLASADPLTRSLLVLDGRKRPAETIVALVAVSLSPSGRGAAEPPERAEPSPTLDAARLGAVEIREALSLLGSAATGLPAGEAARRLGTIGPNVIPSPRGRGTGQIAAGQVASLPVALLAGSALLSLFSGGVLDAVVTLAVIAANAAIGTSSESATERLIRRLSRPVEHEATVVRDGVRTVVPAGAVVPGDVIVLSPGAVVPADARVILSRELSVDESSLTGESLPAEKTAELAPVPAPSLGERHNIVHRGTVVTGGDGRAVVFRTGLATEMARTRALLGTVRGPRPAVEERLDRLVTTLTVGAVAISGLVLAVGLLRGEPLARMLKSVIALAVSAIPEGLPAVSTTALALGAREMEKDGAFVRALTALEDLGSIDTICLDKTGTLTENRMDVVAAWTAGGLREVGDGWAAAADPDLLALAEGVALCNEASLSRAAGSSTEIALLRFADAVGVDHRALRREATLTALQSRNRARRWMATEHARGENGEARVSVKGAPDELLALSTMEVAGGLARPMTIERRAAILEANAALARKGLRVLGVARREGTLGGGAVGGLAWLGLVALADPIRRGAALQIELMHQAGIRTIMITGDQAATALAVAEELKLSRTGVLRVAEGPALAALDDAALGDLALATSVFARVDPADKLRIVRALQGKGRRVAMIGDGVNDGPALRAAAVGVAMGKRGTDVAREVADIVLAEDELGELARAIARGRATEDNIRSAIRYLVSTNLTELGVMLVEALHGRGELETPMELLWLNLATDVLPALGLALADPRGDVMLRPPRSADAALFDRAELAGLSLDAACVAGAALAGHFIMLNRAGVGPRTRTVTFLTLAAGQIAYAFVMRDRSGTGGRGRAVSERRLEAMLAGAAGLLVLPLAVPPLRRIVGLVRLRAPDALLGLGLAAVSVSLAEGWRRVPLRPFAKAAGEQPSPPGRRG